MQASTPWFALHAEAGQVTLRLRGRWQLAELPGIEAAWPAGVPTRWPGVQQVRVEGAELERLDTAAAWWLLERLQGAGDIAWAGLDARAVRVVEQVRRARQQQEAHAARAGAPAAPGRGSPSLRVGLAMAHAARAGLAGLGRATQGFVALLLGHLRFLGATLAALAAALVRPRRVRWRELTVQVEQVGLNAVPVVGLVTLLIGLVLAYLLGLQAEKYGANIFVVDGVAVGATREFAPIIVAVIVAGRSGAAFTAQLGAMRLAEEIDAIRTLGLDPWQVLVVPRVLALVLTLPLLVFVGDVAAIAGAMLVTGPMLDIGPGTFLGRLREALELRHVLAGLAKAPVFALVVAVVATRMGMTVARDTRAVGAATTSTVVQGIVAVILIDALFAVVLQAAGW
ncbi:MAG: ABC transporter permease [Rubrivivax sp.]|nr:ABC transporter permease [Rubrivivax sp.]